MHVTNMRPATQGGIKKGYKTGVTFTGGYGDHHVQHNAEAAPFVKFWSTAKMGTPNVVRHVTYMHFKTCTYIYTDSTSCP
jgi:hypothetical protein